MSRSLSAAAVTAVTAQSYDSCHLIEIALSSTTFAWTDAPVTIVATATGAAGSSWAAIGGVVAVGAAVEKGVDDRQAVNFTFSGVDQTLLSALLLENYVGRRIKLWRAWFSGGVLQATALLFDGFSMDRWEVEEVRDPNGMGTVAISTTATDPLSALGEQARGIRRQVESHNLAIGTAKTDLFFSFVPILGRKRIMWTAWTPNPWFPSLASRLP